ncbi:hypothetical protein RvY_15578 [Ramazzottius varieornatus]|uniref:Uncharacterized protein n=1 Tax=Ramazzottius varieornatus TaxID=947166 RepID=A0A1D1VVE6_RAMVA|nr:hypothetical protein RvY_15578 [Ramazzottius varieornatus]
MSLSLLQALAVLCNVEYMQTVRAFYVMDHPDYGVKENRSEMIDLLDFFFDQPTTLMSAL